MVNSLLLLLATFLYAGDEGWTPPGDPLAVIAQQSTSRGKEQVSIVFDGQGVKLVSNSNFIFPPSDKAKIGLYRSDLNEKLKTRWREAWNIKIRLDKSSTKHHGSPTAYRSPHRIRYFIGGHELEDGAQYYDVVREMLDTAWGLADWSAVDGVEVSLSGKELKLAYSGEHKGPGSVGLAEAGCDTPDKVILCDAGNFGWVHLRR
jgi:hypothetical protein